MSLNILMIRTADFTYPFSDNRVRREAKSLQNAGYSVLVRSRAHGKGQKEGEYDGVHYVRLSSNGILGKLIWNLDAAKEALNPKWNVIHCHDVGSLPVAIAVKLLSGKPVVYDAHEYALGMNISFLHKLLVYPLEFLALSFVDALIVTNNERFLQMKKHYPQIKGKTTAIIDNLEEKSEIENIFPDLKLKRKLKKQKTPIFIYQGVIKQGRGIHILIEAFRECNAAKLVIIGGTEEYTIGNNIFVFKNMPREKMLAITKICDVGVVALLNTCKNNYYAAPIKLSEYMACHCAVLVPEFPHMKRLVVENKMGYSCDFSSKDSIIHAINEVIGGDNNKKKDNAKKMFDGAYNWETQSETELLALYRRL